MLDAQELEAALPSRPVVSNGRDGERDFIVEHYRHPPGAIEVPGLLNTLLVVHMNGPLAVEERRPDNSWVRKWTDKHRVSLTPAGSPVSRRFRGRPDVLLLQLSPRLINEVIEDDLDRDPAQVSIVPCFAQLDPNLDSYARLAATEVQTASAPGFASMLDLLGRALAVNLLRRHSTLDSAASEPPLRIAPARMQRVLDYMREELAYSPSLPDLAAVCGLSPTHFARAFRATTGLPPHRYLVSLRMEQARGLLEHTTLPIAQIALSCGFEQASSFATAFRRNVGVSPRTWRTERRS